MQDNYTILLFHGSTLEKANKTALDFTKTVKAKTNNPNLAAAFINFAKPELNELLDQIASKGFYSIRLIPLFVLPGAHISEDLPNALKSLYAKYPKLKVELLPCLCDTPEFALYISKLLK